MTSVRQAVTDAVSALKLEAADMAAVHLALAYADAIDASQERDRALADLGPKLLQALTALGATPAARNGITKGGAQSGRLAELRAKRTAAG